MDAYGLLYQKLLFPFYEGVVRKRPTLGYLAELERSQWFTVDELAELQSQKLRRLIDHAYTNVPYYRSLLDDAGLHPSAIRGVQDLERLPVLTREAAHAAGKQRAATGGFRVDIWKSTSGTSGVPLAFGYDRDSEYRRQAMRLRGYSWAGYRPGRVAFHYWGSLASQYRPPLAQRLKTAIDHKLRRDHYVDCTAPGTDAHYRAVASQIARVRPDVLICYARAGAGLARYIREHNLRDWPDIPVICGAERVFPHERQDFEAALGPVFETYGSREVMLMAAECPAHKGMHVSMEHLIVEVLTKDSLGRLVPAKPGEVGEVVVTDLHNHGMPFVRYVSGDLAVMAEPGRCDCGRHLARLQYVDGRVTDVLRDAQGNAISGLFFNVMFSTLGDRVRNFQVVQKRDRSIVIRLVPTQRFDRELLGVMKANCSSRFPGLPVATELVDDIPTTASGKRRPVVLES